MSKAWLITEKIISSLQIIFGLLIIYLIFYNNIFLINHYLGETNLGWRDLSFYKIIQNNFLAFTKALFFFMSGILLIKNQTIGWIIGLLIWFNFGLISLLNLLMLHQKVQIVWDINICMLMILCFLNTTILISKVFRKKYKPNWKNWKNWSIILIVLMITLIDIYKILV
ncbi:hypothetical protein OX283_013355 [Flavobacterium sp. SUN052]|uniref:hypothetical protein n=1 Tax=Flavobacterium sp. SUN052 TaxID=3002441 RepID=UPI00237DCFF1|nr:hypothetical protein [Flavobacterium sp. SUN052]MEC4005651.1 hypothetical protein [Flavobacterium sp. SUN052]